MGLAALTPSYDPLRSTILILQRQHPVDHFAGEPEIMRGVHHARELGAGEMLADLWIVRQEIEHGRSAGRDLTTDVIDEVMRALAPEIGPEPHHHGFRNDRAMGDVEVLPHAFLVDLEALD